MHRFRPRPGHIQRLSVGAILAISLLSPLVTASIAAAEESHHEVGNRNLFALFVGGRYDEHESKTVGAIGLNYEYRINELFGVGAFAEYAGGDVEALSFGVPLFIHPYDEFRFALAPGLEHEDSKTHFLFRAGASYEFEIAEDWILAPELNFDFVDSHTNIIYGLNLGRSF